MKIGLLGFGTVGKGTYEILQQVKSQQLEGIEVKRILDITIQPGYEDIMTTRLEDILNDSEIKTVVEVIGGIHPAYEFICAAMDAKKNVVSANKQLIAHKYKELAAKAAENGIEFRFSASVGGGIPWLHNLSRTKRADDIISLCGIMNGTTNYILYNMETKDIEFLEALKQAQELGYAEANPSADIDGLDVQHKCAISANIAFNAIIDETEMDVEGIRRITKADILYFKEKDLTCKLIATASRQGGSITAYVEPTLLEKTEAEAIVPKNFNLISLTGRMSGKLSFFGQGAGKYPTGDTILHDIIDIRNGYCPKRHLMELLPVDNGQEEHCYYIRLKAGCMAPDLKAAIKSEEIFGGASVYITKPISVKAMHAMAKQLKEKDPDMFFAGMRN